MKNYTVFFKRNETSPISYLAGEKPNFADSNITLCEKEGDYKRESMEYYDKPVIKGSHTRGRFRCLVANDIMKEFQEKTDDIKFLAFCAKILFSGAVTPKLSMEDKVDLTITPYLAKNNAFFRNFGAMITFLNSKRSNMGIGHLYPLIDKHNDGNTIDRAKELNLKVLDENVIRQENSSFNKRGGDPYKITYPIFRFETNRVTDKLFEVEKLGKNDEEILKLREYYEEFTTKDKKNGESKSSDMNILYNEVVTPCVDFYENIIFLDDDTETHIGLLTQYKNYFENIEPYIGGRISNHYGVIDSVKIFDGSMQEIEYDDNKYRKFIENSNLEAFKIVFNAYKTVKEKVAAENTKKEENKKKKKEELKEKEEA